MYLCSADIKGKLRVMSSSRSQTRRGGAGQETTAGGADAPPHKPVPEAAILSAIERAMLRLRRSMTRRTLGKRAARELGHPIHPSQFSVVDAIEEGQESPDQEVTVNVIAERLGADPSRASRLVAEAVRAGLVVRVASQVDGRRIQLALTDAGRDLAQAAHRFRRDFFARLMQDWSEEERREFARLLTKFADALAEESRS